MEPVWVDEQNSLSAESANSSRKYGVRKAGNDADEKRLPEFAVLKMENPWTTPAWADLSKGAGHTEEAELAHDESAKKAFRQMTGSAGLYTTKSKLVPARNLKFTHLRDVTTGHQQGSVASLQFHPSKPVLVTASTSGAISLFELCTDQNNLSLKRDNFFLQDVKIPRFRLANVDLFDGGCSILASSSNLNHCYTYDLLNGKLRLLRQPIVMDSLRPRLVRLSSDGSYIAYLANASDIFFFDFKTMEHLHTFRGAENLIDFCFAPFDRNVVYAFAENGAVCTWNLRRCAEPNKAFDEGCVRATCISCSSGGQFIACGSNAGIVNVYDLAQLSSSVEASLKPIQRFSQLTTSISFANFSTDAQLMAFGSNVKNMSIRLAHLSTGTVFSHFPSKQEHFSQHKITCCAFSPNSAFFAMGTSDGKTRLYRLNHFHDY